MSTLAVLLLALLALSRSQTLSTSQTKWRRMVSADVAMTGFARSFSKISLVDCARRCWTRRGCHAFGFYRAGAMCWQYSSLVDYSPRGFSAPGAHYFWPVPSRCPGSSRVVAGICLHVVETTSNWTQANDQCKRFGGRHYIADTSEKLEALLSLPEIEAYWLGATFFHQEGEWRWTNGNRVPDGSNIQSMSAGPDASCLCLLKLRFLYAQACSFALPYVCEVQI